MNFQKAPFPYFGGKSKAAELVWSLLGDVPHYVEPFAGSMAVLLNRPHLIRAVWWHETLLSDKAQSVIEASGGAA